MLPAQRFWCKRDLLEDFLLRLEGLVLRFESLFGLRSACSLAAKPFAHLENNMMQSGDYIVVF